MTSFSRSTKWNGPRLAISSVMLPDQPAWIVGAVRCTWAPTRAFVLLELTKAMKAGFVVGVPTFSLVVHRTNPPGFTISSPPRRTTRCCGPAVAAFGG
jgi:hypothetical protein